MPALPLWAERIRVFRVFRRSFLFLAWLLGITGSVSAEPLSRKTDIDFFRDVPSRNLKGLATRSDGRLVAGPILKEIASPAPADLLWNLEPTPDPAKWLIGTGPEGKIVEITFDSDQSSFTTREFAKLDDPQVFAIKRLADGSVLAGTSPKGALYLVREDTVVARAMLPVDSIFDLLLLDDNTALAATGNPGRIYRIDLQKFATIGLIKDRITDTQILADRGITLFGEVRDRNVRRIVALADGHIAAGSAPKGNVYRFPQDGGAPIILQENRDAEVTDLLPQPNGDLYATVVFAASTGEARISPGGSRPSKDPADPVVSLTPAERFGGRSSLLWFPASGFAEVLTSRSATAFYRVARQGDLLIVAGGEQGELIGYDLRNRLSLTFAGSTASQLNTLVPLPGAAGTADATGKFLLLRNNAPGLAILDFAATGPREIETRRLDLNTPALLGAFRLTRLRDVNASQLGVEVKVSQASDDVEGWGPWTPLKVAADGGWRAADLRGRHVKLRLRVMAEGADSVSPRSIPAGLEIDRGALFSLPQNRRPALQDFRILTPGFAVIPAVEQPPSANVSLSQLLQTPNRDDEGKRKGNFNSSQVVPSPGSQLILWTVADADNDNLLFNFSYRREGDEHWTEVVANSRESYAQFDTAQLPDGIYFTRLVATETAPRPTADRLGRTFETDDLIIDHTPPELSEATARRAGDVVIVSVRGEDKGSLLDGMEVVFNNGVRETVEQPADGVRDGREETFVLEIPLAKISNATSLEVTLYDAAGNQRSRRLTW